MTFWRIFFHVLWRRPLAALAALWWRLTRRRVRARNVLRVAGANLPFAYKFWIRSVERAGELERQVADKVSAWRRRPSFAVVLHAASDASRTDVERSLASVERQFYSCWALLFAQAHPEPVAPDWPGDRIQCLEGAYQSEGEALKAALEHASEDFVVPLRAGDELSAAALFRFAEALQEQPSATILYGDHDELGPKDERRFPWFKPRWNEEMFLALDYLSGASAIPMEVARTLASEFPPVASAYELLLTAARRRGGPVVHVPHIVAHLRASDARTTQDSRVAAVGRTLKQGGATASRGAFGSVKVSWPLPLSSPLVSLIIPTKDKLELLQPCVESVLSKTSYENYEILIIDNGSVEERTAAYLDRIPANPKVRVLPFLKPYNFSEINNFAADHARGSYLCLLNNDTEVVGEEWLTEMMRYAVRPEIGAVGAKLLYGDGTIQHAGVVVGMGDAAGHAHRNLCDTEPGYFSQAHVAHFVTAVTGACLLVEREKYIAVGGLDEQSLAIAYNDVDLCLKLERAGFRNVYVPHAVLIHHESKSRGHDHSPSQIGRYRLELRAFQERWNATTYDDPILNPNLDRSSETFVIRLGTV